jgi:hypothetical protein
LKSVSGQYDLWDTAEKIVATSASSINSALESQITYWDSYNQNLESLNALAADIDGHALDGAGLAGCKSLDAQDSGSHIKTLLCVKSEQGSVQTIPPGENG